VTVIFHQKLRSLPITDQPPRKSVPSYALACF
jgi:hypothetical protein